jgi:hypothetical protein
MVSECLYEQYHCFSVMWNEISNIIIIVILMYQLDKKMKWEQAIQQAHNIIETLTSLPWRSPGHHRGPRPTTAPPFLEQTPTRRCRRHLPRWGRPLAPKVLGWRSDGISSVRLGRHRWLSALEEVGAASPAWRRQRYSLDGGGFATGLGPPPRPIVLWRHGGV